jgi:hypothetical protein
MDMTFRIQQHIIRLDVSMYNALVMYISQCASQLGNPEFHRVFGKGLSRDMKSQVAASHQVHYNIPRQLLALWHSPRNAIAHIYSMSWKLYRKLQMNG